jgi:hypothetical protein
MTKAKTAKPELELKRASYEAEQAKKRLASSLGALQYRLKPGNLVNSAWEGVRDKSGEMADDALQTVSGAADEALQVVKERPRAVSGVLAALVIFLAREPLWRLVTMPFRSHEDTSDVVTTQIDTSDTNYDLTAPAIERSKLEGVSA